jgi:hypothetical protein
MEYPISTKVKNMRSEFGRSLLFLTFKLSITASAAGKAIEMLCHERTLFASRTGPLSSRRFSTL